MGVENSKPAQITRRVENLRDGLRQGEIVLDEKNKQKLHQQLGHFSRQLNNQKRGNREDVTKAQKLINDVIWELYNVQPSQDRRLTPKSSKRYAQTNNKSLKEIVEDVERLEKESQYAKDTDRILGELAGNSQQLAAVARTNKKKDVERVQKQISSLSNDIVRKHMNDLDSAAVESHSFTHVPTRSSLNIQKEIETTPLKRDKSKSLENIDSSSKSSRRNIKSNLGNIKDIEDKLKSIKIEAKTAIDNNDASQLRFLLKSIETLMTNLQLINEDDSILQEKRSILEKDLQRLYRKLNKAKSEMNAQNNIDYLTQLKDKKKIDDTLEHLEELENSLSAIDVEKLSKDNNPKDIATTKEQMSDFKNQVNAIEDLSVDICEKKKQLFGMLQSIERVLLKLELEYKLKSVEEAHKNCKTDLNRFSYFPDSEEFKKYNAYLHELKEYVKKIHTIDRSVEERKKNLLDSLQSTTNILRTKAEENKRKSHKNEESQVVLRKPATNNEELLENISTMIEEFKKNFKIDNHDDINQLRKYQQVLERPRRILEEKLREISIAISRSIQNDSITKITTKLIDNPHVLQKITPTQLAGQNSSRRSDVKPISKSSLAENEAGKSTDRLDEIEGNVSLIETQIRNNPMKKDSEEYQRVKNQLDGQRKRLRSLCLNSEHRKSATNVLKKVESVLYSLENNSLQSSPPKPSPKPDHTDSGRRRSTTEHILNDILSVQSRVQELLNKFTGIGSLRKEDFTNIKKKLYEHKDYLMRLDLSTYSHTLCKSRDGIVSEINEHLTFLDTLPQKNYERFSSSEERTFHEQCKTLKDKVSRFNGSYKNVLYRKLEEDLNKHLKDTDLIIKDPNQAQRTKMDLHANLKILENKSMKDTAYGSTEQLNVLSNIQQEVNDIKTEVYSPEVKSNKDLEVLDGRLNLQNLSLDNLHIPQGPIQQEKIILQQEIDGCLSHISQRQQTTPLEVQSLPQTSTKPKPSPEKELEQIEQALNVAKVEILSFIGLETSKKFYELDETLIRATLTLDQMKFERNNPLQVEKTRLLREIHNFSEILDERVRQTETMQLLEEEAKEMFLKLDGILEEEFDQFDEHLINLKLKAGKFEANQHLSVRKNLCLQQIDECMKKFNVVAANKRGKKGTLV